MDLKKLQILLIDDEPASLEASRTKLAMYVAEENIHTATNAVEVMRLMNTLPILIAFVDVEMPETDGFTIVDYIRQIQPQTQIVFLTGHAEMGAKSYDYEPLDFLTKPLDVLRLKRTFERYEQYRNTRPEQLEQLALDGAKGFVLISPAEIQYIAREGRKNVLHLKDMTHEVRTPLDELELMLEDYGFFRCHQSVLVSVSQIRSVTQADFGRTYTANLVSGVKLPVSRGKFPLLRAELEKRGVHFL